MSRKLHSSESLSKSGPSKITASEQCSSRGESSMSFGMFESGFYLGVNFPDKEMKCSVKHP